MRDREIYKNVQFEDIIVIGLIIAIILIVILVLFTGIHSERAKIDEYNNGVCKQCGGKYEYIQAIGHQYCTTYLYKCRQCGKMLELSEAR